MAHRLSKPCFLVRVRILLDYSPGGGIFLEHIGSSGQAVFGGWASTFEAAMESCSPGPGAGCDDACLQAYGTIATGETVGIGFPFERTIGEETGYEMPCACKCTIPI